MPRLLVALAIAFLPSLAEAAFQRVYPAGYGVNPVEGGSGQLVRVDVVFDTNAVDLSGSGTTGILGWGVRLTGSVGGSIVDFASGGAVDPLSSCLSISWGTTCSAADDGSFVVSGASGIGVPLFSIDFLIGDIGSQLILDAWFVEADFSTTFVSRVLAREVPEPGSALLLAASLAGLALCRRLVPGA